MFEARFAALGTAIVPVSIQPFAVEGRKRFTPGDKMPRFHSFLQVVRKNR